MDSLTEKYGHIDASMFYDCDVCSSRVPYGGANVEGLLADVDAELSRLRQSLEWETAAKHGAEADTERHKNVADSLRAEVADLKRQLAEAQKALTLMYDKWENGTPSYEDVEEMSGHLGNAFNLSDPEENQVLFALELMGVETALRKDKLTDEQRAAIDAARENGPQ